MQLPDLALPAPHPGLLRFGATLATCVNLIATGAPRDGDDGAGEGSVWIHRLEISEGPRLEVVELARLASGVRGDRFGGTVALSRDVEEPPVSGAHPGAFLLAVGADGTGADVVEFAGAVHLFTATELAKDSWRLRQLLFDPRPEPGAEFGRAIALGSGPRAPIAVAAPRADVADALDAGRVVLYLRDVDPTDAAVDDEGLAPIDVALLPIELLLDAMPTPRRAAPGGWSAAAELSAPVHVTSGWFGYSLAISGDHLAIGEPGAPATTASGTVVGGAGAVHVYRLEDAGPRLIATLRPPVAEHAAWFGLAVALDGGTLAVGSPRARRDGIACGAAYVYALDRLDAPPRLVRAPLAQPGLGFGGSIAIGPEMVAIGGSGFDLVGPRGEVEDAGSVWAFGRADLDCIARLASDHPEPAGHLGHVVRLAESGGPVAVSGHLFVEEESAAPSRGVVFHRLDFPAKPPDGRAAPAIADASSPPADTSARRSGASPHSSRSR